jgi:hypothetical protein
MYVLEARLLHAWRSLQPWCSSLGELRWFEGQLEDKESRIRGAYVRRSGWKQLPDMAARIFKSMYLINA